jgi:signal transduction histidine kinase
MTLDGSAETNKPQGEHSVKGSWTPTLSLRLNTAGAAERLLAAIAHELRNPIEGLGNALYLLRLSGTNDQVELIDTAESELQRIRQIVTALLDEYKRSSVERVRVSLAEVIEETLAFYEHKIRFKKIKVEKQFSAPGDIEAVPGQMRQVFTNLIINSLEAVCRRCLPDRKNS